MPALQPSTPSLQQGKYAQGLVLAVPMSNRLVRDYSPGGRAVSFAGNVVFTSGPGGWLLSHTESAARTNFGTASYFSLSACTIVLAQRKTSGLANACSFGTPLDTNKSFGALLPYGNGVVYWDWGGTVEGSTRLSVAGLTVADNVWAFTTGPRGMEVWQDGIRRASNSATPTRAAGAGVFGLGNYTGGSDVVSFKALLAYDRQLPESIVRELSEDPWLPWRPKPRIIDWAQVLEPTAAGAGPSVAAIAATYHRRRRVG